MQGYRFLVIAKSPIKPALILFRPQIRPFWVKISQISIIKNPHTRIKKEPFKALLLNGAGDEARLGFTPRSQNFVCGTAYLSTKSVRYPD